MKKIQEIYNNIINETFNLNDIGWDNSKEFLQKIHKVHSADDYEESALNPIQELKVAIAENDDEVDIEYDDGRFIRLDINIVKYLVANFSDEELFWALDSYESLTNMLEELYEVIEADEEVADSIEDIIGDKDD